MSVAVSVQEYVKIDQASNELRSSPSFFISKIHKIAHCECIASDLSIVGMEELGNGLDNHKICIDNIKTLLSSSKYDRQRPHGLTMMDNMVKEVVSRTSHNTKSKDSFAYTECEVRDHVKLIPKIITAIK